MCRCCCVSALLCVGVPQVGPPPEGEQYPWCCRVFCVLLCSTLSSMGVFVLGVPDVGVVSPGFRANSAFVLVFWCGAPDPWALHPF